MLNLQLKNDEKCLHNFCVIYRQPSLKLTDFQPKLESILRCLNFSKVESLIFGDFNIDILKKEKRTKNYENLLRSFDFQVQNSMPKRITKYSKSCIDHIITETNIKTETLATTISNHFILTAEFFVSSIKFKNIQSSVLMRNLKSIKTDKAQNLRPESQKNPENLNANDYMSTI